MFFKLMGWNHFCCCSSFMCDFHTHDCMGINYLACVILTNHFYFVMVSVGVEKKVLARHFDLTKKIFSSNFIHSGPENLKKSRPKKLMKSNKSISQKNFGHLKNSQKWNFWIVKKFKTARNAISWKNFVICLISQ